MKIIPSILILGLAAAAHSATLIWDKNPEPEVTRYRVWAGTNSRAYATNFIVTTNAWQIDPNLLAGGYNYFAVTALATNGLESDLSAEVKAKPAPPSGIRVGMILQGSDSPAGPWQDTTNTIHIAIVEPKQFYRTRLTVAAQ